MSALMKAASLSGPTVNRPTGAKDGYCYFDSDLAKPVWALASAATGWVDALGVVV